MADYMSREAASADECKHKIKTPFAKIIVGGTPENPCYDILYFDPADGECHIGFGSYRLDYVFQWLAEEFEITEPCADVVPVRNGRWVDFTNAACMCPVCGAILAAHSYDCPNCGAKMDGGAEDG